MHTHRSPRRVLILLAFVCASVAPLKAASLIRDIDTTPTSIHLATNAGCFTEYNGMAYFIGVFGQAWLELGRTDGTQAGTELVADIRPGYLTPFSLYPIPTPPPLYCGSQLFSAGGLLYFSTWPNGLGDQELWRSDGTSAGTFRVLAKGAWSVVESNGSTFFNDRDGALWTTDGTLSGTTLIKGDGLATYYSIVDSNGILFFIATDPVNGEELWKSDGTPGGTVLVKDIVPGAAGSSPRLLTPVGDSLFFRVNGNELWKSDGTAAGTVLVKSFTGNLDDLLDVDGTAFCAVDSPHQLWKSDGTAAGTVLVQDLPYSAKSQLVNADGIVFWIDGLSLWKSDGTAAGTASVASFLGFLEPEYNVTELEAIGGTVYFSADDGTIGNELWKSDGTGPGTVAIADINPAGGSGPHDLGAVGGTLYFSVYYGSSDLWSTNGSGATDLSAVVNGTGSSVRRGGAASNGTLFVRADDGSSGNELWKTDGTFAGTVLVKDVNPGPADGVTQGPWEKDGLVLFVGDDGATGAELWTTDGTAAGTTLVKDINPGSGSANLGYVSSGDAVNGKVAFRADDGTHGPEWWTTDGTPAGTTLLLDIWPGSTGQTTNTSKIVSGGWLFFTADDPIYTNALWRTDGTTVNTIRLADQASSLRDAGGTLLFANDSDPLTGKELWKSDGTPGGTLLVKDINPGSGDGVSSILNAVGSIVFFLADDGTGVALWRSDGTAAGTLKLKDIPSGVSYSQGIGTGGLLMFFLDGSQRWKSDGTVAGTSLVRDLSGGGTITLGLGFARPINGRIVFVAADDVTGRDLWVSDGTAAGTFSLDLAPGPRDAFSVAMYYGYVALPTFINVGDRLVFKASDGSTGLTTWVTDGTPGGTYSLGDIEPGPAPTVEETWVAAALGDTLVFSEYNIEFGHELWNQSLSALGPAPPAAPDGSAGTTPLGAARLPGGAIHLTWDTTSCPATDYNLLYGGLADVASVSISGSECALGLGGSYTWAAVPAADTFFLIVGTDGTVTESSWGVNGSNDERNGLVPSGACSVTAKNVSQTCP